MELGPDPTVEGGDYSSTLPKGPVGQTDRQTDGLGVGHSEHQANMASLPPSPMPELHLSYSAGRRGFCGCDGLVPDPSLRARGSPGKGLVSLSGQGIQVGEILQSRGFWALGAPQGVWHLLNHQGDTCFGEHHFGAAACSPGLHSNPWYPVSQGRGAPAPLHRAPGAPPGQTPLRTSTLAGGAALQFLP